MSLIPVFLTPATEFCQYCGSGATTLFPLWLRLYSTIMCGVGRKSNVLGRVAHKVHLLFPRYVIDARLPAVKMAERPAGHTLYLITPSPTAAVLPKWRLKFPHDSAGHPPA